MYMATRKVTNVAIAIFAPSPQELALVLMAPKVPSNRTGFYNPFGTLGFVAVTFRCRVTTVGRAESMVLAETANAYSLPQTAGCDRPLPSNQIANFPKTSIGADAP
jgi:hypothetical protein